MSDNFIPLNQSTPVQNRWHQDKQQRYNNRQHSGQWRGGYNNWNNSRSSYGSNSSNNSSYNQDRQNIDAYLHPSMLQDPWANLRQRNSTNSSTNSSSFQA